MVASDLSKIPTESIRTAVKEVIENKLKSKHCKINVSSASSDGEDGFIGVIYGISFSEEDDNENGNNPVSSMILKVAPKNEARRKLFNSRACFLREIYMYEKVLPFFHQFELSKGIILEEDGFNQYPKFYTAVDKELSECVLLDDLSVYDFSMVDRFTQPITADHVRLIMRLLGKFHAISFALKDQQPEKFNELTSCLDEILVRNKDPQIIDFFNNKVECLLNAVSGEPRLGAKIKDIFKNGAIDVANECLDLNAIGDAAVISHSDTWSNNTMIRNDNSGKPTDIRLIDWQYSRVGSPIMDIVYFLFISTTKGLRDSHYNDFLNVYHENLSAHIRLGSDPEKLFSYKMMLEHFRKFGKFGLIVTSFMLQIVTKDDGNKSNMDGISVDTQNRKAELFISSESSRKRFYKRLREVIVDMDRLEII